ncbi:MAG: fluoride efflux transporter CrcB [Myxococcota bacterium]|jgi:fluoride exporter|nr:fluoride efflux transporter CrcB [Myxococcota bacterium]
MLKLILIAIGGGMGTLARYGMAGFAQRLADHHFPVGTLMVNLLGCFAVGAISAFFAGPVEIRDEYRWALVAGFLGGFTTFSAFGFETFVLFESREAGFAWANIVVSTLGGLAAVWAGYRLVGALQHPGVG